MHVHVTLFGIVQVFIYIFLKETMESMIKNIVIVLKNIKNFHIHVINVYIMKSVFTFISHSPSYFPFCYNNNS